MINSKGCLRRVWSGRRPKPPRDDQAAVAAECELLRERPRQTLIGDKNYFGGGFERELSEPGVQLLWPARKGERERPGTALLKPLRQVIEPINETSKGQLNLEQHRGRTPPV